MIMEEKQVREIQQGFTPLPSIDETLIERGSRYGKFADHATVTQRLKNVMHNSPNWTEGKLTDAQKESLEMIAHKIGRILNGDPNYDDSWIDIEGYAKLITKQLQGKGI